LIDSNGLEHFLGWTGWTGWIGLKRDFQGEKDKGERIFRGK